MRITISGHIGSGKTTVSNILGGLTGYQVYSGGFFFRRMAKEMGISLEELNLISEEDSSTDFKLNELIEQFIRDHDEIIVESRLAGWISYNAKIPVYRVFLEGSLETRVRRVASRENQADMMEKVRIREQSEDKRFKSFFNFDMDDKSIYDTVINTEEGSAEEIANKIYKLVFSRSG